MEDHLAKPGRLAAEGFRGKGSSFVASTDRKTSLLRDRPARRAVKRAYRIWVSAAAHHCVQLRIDLLFTMSDNLHRVIVDRRDTNSMHGRALVLVARECFSRPPSLKLRRATFAVVFRIPTATLCEGWLANRSRKAAKVGGARRDRTDDLLLAKQALSQLSYGPGCERYAP